MSDTRTLEIDPQSHADKSAFTEITRLTQLELSAHDYYSLLLSELPTPMGTMGKIVWLQAAEQFEAIGPDRDFVLPFSHEAHTKLLHQVKGNSAAKVLKPPAQAAADAATPVIVLASVRTSGVARAIVEVFLKPDVSTTTVNRFAAELELICAMSVAHHSRSDQASSLGDLQTFTKEIHRSLRVDETCYAIANEGRRITKCDRVSVLVRKGDKYSLTSVTGLASIHRRANIVRTLEDLTRVTMLLGESFWYPDRKSSVANTTGANRALDAGLAKDLPPQIESYLDSYLDEAHSLALGILPIYEAQVAPAPADIKSGASSAESSSEFNAASGNASKTRKRPIGAIVLEQLTEKSGERPSLNENSQFLAQQAGTALGHAVAQQRIFLLPLWRWLGGFGHYFFDSRKRKTQLLLGTVATAVALLCLVPAPFRINSPGQLQPVTRGNAFAPMDAKVQEIHVSENETVTQNQKLLTLRSTPLDLEIRKLKGERLTLKKRIDSIQARRLSTQATDQATVASLQAESAEEEDLRQQLISVENQLALREEMRNELVVLSPIAGEVVTWNLIDLLQDRPVTQGQLLMEVVDTKKKWTLELKLPDRSIAHLLRAKEHKEAALDVTYLLASNPGQRFSGKLKKLERRTNAAQESGQFVRATIEIDETDVEIEQPGTEVQARIECGHRPLGYVWFHGVWEFLQSRVFFRLW